MNIHSLIFTRNLLTQGFESKVCSLFPLYVMELSRRIVMHNIVISCRNVCLHARDKQKPFILKNVKRPHCLKKTFSSIPSDVLLTNPRMQTLPNNTITWLCSFLALQSLKTRSGLKGYHRACNGRHTFYQLYFFFICFEFRRCFSTT